MQSKATTSDIAQQTSLDSPRRFTSLDGAMLGVLALQIACNIVAAIAGVGWGSAAGSTGLTALALLALAALRSDWRPLLLRLLAFGLVAGVCELFTDYSGETVAHSLNYPTREPMLWTSPAYMPFSWMVVLTLIGYLAWRLDSLGLRRWQAMALVALWGAANIPFYEEMAYSAGWWRYTPVPGRTVFHTPLYVLIFEGLIGLALPPLLAHIDRRGLRSALVRGLALGAWLPLAGYAAWLLIGR